MALARRVFGTTADGREVEQFTLTNKNGMEVQFINFGCCLTNIWLPSSDGQKADILLGYDTLAAYEANHTFQGAFVGRYANRIQNASFELHGAMYHLPQNDGENFLHGCFHKRLFKAEPIGNNSVSLTYTSPDGEEGFPGELWVAVSYTLTEDNEFVMDYRALSDKDTHANFTNHSYFNLSGVPGSLHDHTLLVNSTSFLEADASTCPTGRIVDAREGAFDFTVSKLLCQDIEKPDPQLALAGGYDHCFILEKKQENVLALAANLGHPTSGRQLHVYTTQPAMQLYTGNYLSEQDVGKNNVPFGKRGGVCLETQHYPCSPSFPDFPSTLVRAGEKFHEITILKLQW